MSQVDAILASLVQKTRSVDPAVADSFILITNELKRLGAIVDPAPVIQAKTSSVAIPLPPSVLSATYTLNPRSITITWEAPSPTFLLYELRLGTSWNTATRVLITGTLSITLDPLLVGTTSYLLDTLNDSGVYSGSPLQIDIVVPPLGAFVLSTSQLSNSILLSWTIPDSTFNIAYYIVTREGVELARITGTFLATTEFVGGSVTYGVTAYDIAGNASGQTLNTTDIPAPSDFELQAEFESAFSGTKTRAVASEDGLLVCVNTTETYQQHFTTRAWTTIQNQISAGYPRYIQPVPTTASYKETFDTGVIYTNTIVNLSYLYRLITGTFTVGFSTRVSDDGISWSAANTSMSFLATSVRYIEVTINFTGSSDIALMLFYHFHVAVSVRREVDGGEVSALSSDANGTVVTFNKAFKDVESITVSVKTTTEHFTAVYRFTDVPNPTQFTVFAYDSSGIRVSKTVEWKARGVL